MGRGSQPGFEGPQHRLRETAEQIRERGEFAIVEDIGGVAQVTHTQTLHEVHYLLAQGSDCHGHHSAVVWVRTALDEAFCLRLAHDAAHGGALEMHGR